MKFKLGFANLISRLFDPLVVLSFLTVAAAGRSGMAGEALVKFLSVFFIAMILPPVALLSWALVTGRVGDWDVSNRPQRVKALAVFFVMILVDLLLVKIFGNAELVKLFLLFLIWFLGFFAITLFWKISGHVSSNALATELFIYWYGLGWWPILLIVPLVAWARVVTKNHTLGQVIVGAVYSWSLVFIAANLQLSI